MKGKVIKLDIENQHIQIKDQASYEIFEFNDWVLNNEIKTLNLSDILDFTICQENTTQVFIDKVYSRENILQEYNDQIKKMALAFIISMFFLIVSALIFLENFNILGSSGNDFLITICLIVVGISLLGIVISNCCILVLFILKLIYSVKSKGK